MTQVYFRCFKPKEVLVDRCGAVGDDLAEARDQAAYVVRFLTMAQPRRLARLDLARQRAQGHRSDRKPLSRSRSSRCSAVSPLRETDTSRRSLPRTSLMSRYNPA